MKLTNKHNLPKAFYRAVKNDTYSKGDADYSSTGLLTPPQQAALRKLHSEDVVEDVSDRVWAIMGTSVHAILEQSAKPWRHFLNESFDRLMESEHADYHMVEGKPELVEKIGMIDLLKVFSEAATTYLAKALRFQKVNQIYAERRYFAEIEVDGKIFKISGQIDLIETIANITDLADFKTVSVWGIVNVKDKMEDWQAQLSQNAWLANKNGVQIHTTQIIAIIRDWSKNKAQEEMRNSYNGQPNYPQQAVISIPVDMLSLEETEELIRRKIRALEADVPRDCSDKEIWLRDSCYAFFNKPGLKRATKLVKGKGKRLEKDAQEVLAIALQDPKKSKAYLEFRPGSRPRCEDYCDVAEWCPQFQKHLEQLKENT